MTITVAILDNGTQASVFNDNNYLYINEGEIAGDGIDNDGNGYIDDYSGIDLTAIDTHSGPASNNHIPFGNGHGHGMSLKVRDAFNEASALVGNEVAAKILNVKITSNGVADHSAIEEGIIAALASGAKVISVSYSVTSETALQRWSDLLAEHDAVLVTYAGSSGVDSGHYDEADSNYDNIIKVSRIVPDGSGMFSGPGIEFLETQSSHSAAIAEVAGKLWSIWSLAPELTVAQLWKFVSEASSKNEDIIINNNAQDASQFGLLNLERAIEAIQQSVGTNGNDTINGDASDDYLFGRGGDDVISGGAGNDEISGGDGIDTINGGSGDDFINGGRGLDIIDGGSGNDTLSYYGNEYQNNANGVTVFLNEQKANIFQENGVGTEYFSNIENVEGTDKTDALIGNGFDNILIGNGGRDFLQGLGGDDHISGGEGEDVLYGGDGNDTNSYLFSASAVTASLATNSATYQTASGITETENFIEFENLEGSNFDDNLTGDNNANRLIGKGGDDRLYASLGDDTLDGGEGSDTADYSVTNAGVTVNLIAGTAIGADISGDQLIAIENIIGGAGNDVITGDDSSNTLIGGSGNDTIIGGAGDDVIEGGLGADNLQGGEGSDTLIIEGGTNGAFASLEYHVTRYVDENNNNVYDTITGFESLRGSHLDDILMGNSESNRIEGMDGDDLILTTGGNDVILGGNGSDTISYEMNTSGVSVNLSSTGFSFVFIDGEVQVLESIENVTGSSHSDTILGLDGISSTIKGGAGNDTIDGRAGGNEIFGEGGNDTITINNGDILHGGTGSDVFVFKDTIDTATLADFETGIDTIRLSGAEFGWNITGELLEDMYQFGSELPDAFAQNEPVLFFNTTTNELSYDATGGTLDDSHVIATLSTGTLSISDFEIV